ncbi:MAG: hypothetical protein V4707_08700 [Pseudomonadota bacterium]
MRPALLSLLMFAAPTAALAQNPWEPSATIEQAVARTIAEAQPDLRYPWALDWSAFGVRGGRDVFWHLAPPKPYEPNPAPPGVTRRSGWLNVRGRSGGVIACGGDERVGALYIDIGDTWLGEADLVAELRARGFAVTETTMYPARPIGDEDDGRGSAHYNSLLARHPAFQSWRLERPGFEPLDLSASYRCTPPGTRSATRCEMQWTVTFRPDDRTEPCLPPEASSN